MNGKAKKPSLGRHKRNCSVCSHPHRAEIEAAFVSWRSPAAIAQEYGLADRASVYRHAHAFGLFVKRQRNIRVSLEWIIEKAAEVDPTASAVVAAVQAYSKINSMGQWIERSEHLDMNALFERMSTAELEAYARDGTLPGWFTDVTAGRAIAVHRTQVVLSACTPLFGSLAKPIDRLFMILRHAEASNVGVAKPESYNHMIGIIFEPAIETVHSLCIAALVPEFLSHLEPCICLLFGEYVI
jgi:hypothetical protein